MRKRLIGLLAGSAAALATMAMAQQSSGYTVNGATPPPETQQQMAMLGMPPGAYVLHDNGDFGPEGAPLVINLATGGPAIGGGSPVSAEMIANPNSGAYASGGPSPSASNAGASSGDPSSDYPALVKEATRARIFWVYSPSIFSGSTGGASGYVHLCPNGLALRSSEGAINVGGGRNDGGWGGVAHNAQSAGRWTIERGADGPMLAVYDRDGDVQRVAVATVRQGSWKFGQTKYAIERNKASCPQ